MARSAGPAPGWVPLPLRLRYLLALVLLMAMYTVVASAQLSPLASVTRDVSTWVEVPLGLLVLLFAPGYGLLTLGAGKRPPWPWYLTFVLIVGLSVAFNLAIGLVLLALNYGLPAVVFGLAALLVDAAAAVRAWLTPRTAPDTRFAALVRRELRLPGFSDGQRAAAYVLLVAILLVLGGIAYLAIVQPRNTQDVTFSVTGGGSNSSTLPTRGYVGQPLTVLVDIRNGGTPTTWTLGLRAWNLSMSPTSYQTLLWGDSHLGNNSTSSVGIPMTAGEFKVETVPFQFPSTGQFALNFTLSDPSGTALRWASFSVSIGNPPR